MNFETTNRPPTLEDLESLIRSQKRVCLFIDNSNLFHSLRQLGNKKLDYVRLRDILGAGRQIDVRFYYSEQLDENSKFDTSPEKRVSRDRFYGFLEDKLGFQMIRLPLRERSGYDATVSALVNRLRSLGIQDDEILSLTNQKSYWLRQIEGESVAEEKGLDCEIVYDMSRLARLGNYDSFVLVAGDEDYARSVWKLRNETGLPVEVAFFGNARCSVKLMKEASLFVDLNMSPGLLKDFDSKY